MSRGENQQSPMAILHDVSKPAFEFTKVMQFSAKYVSCFFVVFACFLLSCVPVIFQATLCDRFVQRRERRSTVVT